ncbi:MAG: YceI family protein [Flavobacteriales bacterium]
MKKRFYIYLYVGLYLLSSFLVFSPLDDYIVTSGHSIAFKSADPSGKFATISGTVSYNESNPEATKVSLTIPVSSLSTGNALMNKKAMTAEWFDQGKFPNITFVSTSVKNDKGELQIYGTMTAKGVEKTYLVKASIKKQGNKLTLSGRFPVNRISFGIGKKSETVPDIMNVSYTLPVIKK